MDTYVTAKSASIEVGVSDETQITINGFINMGRVFEYKNPDLYSKTQHGDIEAKIIYTKNNTEGKADVFFVIGNCLLFNSNTSSKVKFFINLPKIDFENLQNQIESSTQDASLQFNFNIGDILRDETDGDGINLVEFSVWYTKFFVFKNFKTITY